MIGKHLPCVGPRNPNRTTRSNRLGNVERVTLTLTVDAAVWNRHVDTLAARVPGLVPVVKGNGYGFGRAWLAERAATLAPLMAVGTIHEVADVPSNYSAVVLTPALDIPFPLRDNVVLTVGSDEHARAAADRPGRRVLIKVRSSMHRYGIEVDRSSALVMRCNDLGLQIAGYSIHPPLAGSSADHRHEIERLVDALDAAGADPTAPIWVSHVDVEDYLALRAARPSHHWHLRLGTALWHGDKAMFALRSEVVDRIAVTAGTTVGYRGTAVPGDGHLVMVGCGSAHGVAPLADGRSPFHFERRRLDLIEPPHMHTSMCFVAEGDAVPMVGDPVDVQRPLTMTTVDCIHWI